MIQINPREIAAEALMEIMTAEAYNNMTLRRLLRQNGAMPRQDRAFVTEVVNGTLRNLIYIDHVLNTFSKTKTEKMKPWLLAVMRSAVYQMYFMDVPDSAACNEAVKLAGVRGYASLKGFVNGVLRTAAKKKNEIPMPETGTAEYLSVAYSHPLWLVRMWMAYYGYEDAEKICLFDNEAPDVTIRVNTLKTNKKELKEMLEAAGVEVTEGHISENALHLTKTADLSRLEAFQKGFFHVQDESSQLAVKILDPQKGDTVIDLCAAPGGKSFTASQYCGENGKLVSCDLYEQRAALTKKGAERLNIKNLQAFQNDATVFNPDLGTFHRVLCDVPCSGFGVIRRKPEIKYKSLSEFDNLPEIQLQILETSVKYLRPEGRIMYSTCTVRQAENRNVIDAFLNKHAEFEIVSEKTLMPHTDGTDGFYFCVLRGK